MVFANSCSAAIVSFNNRAAFEAAALSLGLTVTSDNLEADPGNTFPVMNDDGGVMFGVTGGSYVSGAVQDTVFGSGPSLAELSANPTGKIVGIGFESQAVFFFSAFPA